MYVFGSPYGVRSWVIRVLSSIGYVRVRLALRCTAVGQSCAELYGTRVRAVSPTVYLTVVY